MPGIEGMQFYRATCIHCGALGEEECCTENAIMSWNSRSLEDELKVKLDLAVKYIKATVQYVNRDQFIELLNRLEN